MYCHEHIIHFRVFNETSMPLTILVVLSSCFYKQDDYEWCQPCRGLLHLRARSSFINPLTYIGHGPLTDRDTQTCLPILFLYIFAHMVTTCGCLAGHTPPVYTKEGCGTAWQACPRNNNISLYTYMSTHAHTWTNKIIKIHVPMRHSTCVQGL